MDDRKTIYIYIFIYIHIYIYRYIYIYTYMYIHQVLTLCLSSSNFTQLLFIWPIEIVDIFFPENGGFMWICYTFLIIFLCLPEVYGS